jgi:hypothetical protein
MGLKATFCRKSPEIQRFEGIGSCKITRERIEKNYEQ